MLSNKVDNINKKLSWLIAVVFFVSFYTLYIDFKPIYPILSILILVYAVYSATPLLDGIKRKMLGNLFFGIIVLWLWCVVLAFVQGADKPMRFRELEFLIIGGLLAYLLCNTKPKVIPLYIVYSFIVFFFYYQYFIIGADSHGVMGAVSGAMNTIILLSIGVAIQVVEYRDNQKIPLLPSLVILPIAIMSWNRTGLITTILFIITTFYVGSSNVKRKSTRFVLYIVITIFLGLLVVSNYDWFQGTGLYSKFEQKGAETGREDIWKDYFNNFGFLQLIFGKPIDERHLLLGTFANAHNSYIMLHSQIGILAIIFFFIVINRLVLYWKKNKFIFLLFMVIFIRGFFDMAYFFHSLDFVFYIFLTGSKELVLKQDNPKITII